MLMSFSGLSSAATRLELSAPQLRQRCIIAHSPSFLTQTATASMTAPQSDALSPGVLSRCRLQRHLGQWLRFLVPPPSNGTSAPQALQIKLLFNCIPPCIYCTNSAGGHAVIVYAASRLTQSPFHSSLSYKFLSAHTAHREITLRERERNSCPLLCGKQRLQDLFQHS